MILHVPFPFLSKNISSSVKPSSSSCSDTGQRQESAEQSEDITTTEEVEEHDSPQRTCWLQPQTENLLSNIDNYMIKPGSSLGGLYEWLMGASINDYEKPQCSGTEGAYASGLRELELFDLGRADSSITEKTESIDFKATESISLEKSNTLECFIKNILKNLKPDVLLLSSSSDSGQADEPNLHHAGIFDCCYLEELMSVIELLQKFMFINNSYVEENLTDILIALKYELEKMETIIHSKNFKQVSQVEYIFKTFLPPISDEISQKLATANAFLENLNYEPLAKGADPHFINSILLGYLQKNNFPSYTPAENVLNALTLNISALKENVEKLEDEMKDICNILKILETSFVKILTSHLPCSNQKQQLLLYSNYRLFLEKLVNACTDCYARRLPFTNINLMNQVINIANLLLYNGGKNYQKILEEAKKELHKQTLENSLLIVELVTTVFKILIGVNKQGKLSLIRLLKSYTNTRITEKVMQALEKENALLHSWFHEMQTRIQHNCDKQLGLNTAYLIALEQTPNSRAVVIAAYRILQYVMSIYFANHLQKLTNLLNTFQDSSNNANYVYAHGSNVEGTFKQTETLSYSRFIKIKDIIKLQLHLRLHKRLIEPHVYAVKTIARLKKKKKKVQHLLKNLWKFIFYLENGAKILKKAAQHSTEYTYYSQYLILGYASLFMAQLASYNIMHT